MELHRPHPGPARLQACANDIGGEFPTMGHERSWLSDNQQDIHGMYGIYLTW